MNPKLIGELIRLRYKLLWAKTRTRNGKIALFFAVYLLLIMAFAILAAGGVGAGVVAVKSGKATRVAAALLSGLFLQALLASVILGFGINEIFSETELRRYPLRAADRQVARHLLGMADPFWLLFLVLEIGIAAGLYLFGAGSFWLGLIAVLLLFVCNYLVARVLAMLIGRLVKKKGGSSIMLALIMLVGFLPGILMEPLKRHPGAVKPLIQALHYTPPAGAAVAITGTSLAPLSGLAIVFLWMAAAMAALVLLERHPAVTRTVSAGKLSWGGPLDRLGRLFGPDNALLAGQWLRFYSRNNRFRTIYPLSVPLIGFMVFLWTRQGMFGSGSNTKYVVSALGGFMCVGFMGSGQFAVNQFGYVGTGFRRYMLLPTDPAAILRAGSYAFLLMSSLLIPVAALAWAIFAPIKTDARMMIMLVSCSVVGMFGMNAGALWIAVLAPRRGNYYASFGNDLSFGANLYIVGGIFLLLFLPRILSKLAPGAVTESHWWMAVLLAAAAVIGYRASLRAAMAAFRTRREHLLAVTEGRNQ